MNSGLSSKQTSSCKWPINLLNKLLQINNTNTATIRNIGTYTPQYYSIGFWLGCGPLDSLPTMISKLVYQGSEVRNKNVSGSFSMYNSIENYVG